MRAPELIVGVLRGKGLLDPRTGLPGRELLIDRLSLALTRARTHGTLVSLVLVPGNAEVAMLLRKTMRDDHTVARYEPLLVAIVAEHPHGDARPIVERVRTVTSARTAWYTSDGTARVHEVLFRAEATLIRQAGPQQNGPGSFVAPGPGQRNPRLRSSATRADRSGP
ncbi:hypothetical protein KIPE111705_16265 [Kibdelosporangium persicum]|uniref:hypothetical protein n=1 Tax=Kibdelosporangium persicum TaxID=2698649 RepID=UPI001564D029|nr:hypothetical protein [Kibdelosporangium persicum]